MILGLGRLYSVSAHGMLNKYQPESGRFMVSSHELLLIPGKAPQNKKCWLYGKTGHLGSVKNKELLVIKMHHVGTQE